MNGFPDAKIPKEFKSPIDFFCCGGYVSDWFRRTAAADHVCGQDSAGITAVQTLSRLNRACPGKDEVYVLDFANKTSDIEEALSKFYKTTILSVETDPNKLYDLINVMEDLRYTMVMM